MNVRTLISPGFALIAIVSACTNDTGQKSDTQGVKRTSASDEAALFIPNDAANVTTAAGIPWMQKSFDISRKPFEFGISPDQLLRAKTDGWTLCQPLSEEWMGYEDATTQPTRYVQQRAYVLHRRDVLVTLIGRYYADSELELAQKLQTKDKTTQHAMVIARNSTAKEAQEVAESLALSCDQTMPVR
jgi:hypothetical protein